MNDTVDIELILTFSHTEQSILSLHFEKSITEKEFLHKIFNELDISKLHQLIKISCCQYTKTDDEQLLSFLEPRNGKYFFNIEKPESCRC